MSKKSRSRIRSTSQPFLNHYAYKAATGNSQCPRTAKISKCRPKTVVFFSPLRELLILVSISRPTYTAPSGWPRLACHHRHIEGTSSSQWGQAAREDSRIPPVSAPGTKNELPRLPDSCKCVSPCFDPSLVSPNVLRMPHQAPNTMSAHLISLSKMKLKLNISQIFHGKPNTE